MRHLSVDEITNFVSSCELNTDTIALFKTVNGHIRECPKCLKLVQSFQKMYDEFSLIDSTDDFRSYVCDMNDKFQKKTVEIDEYR